MSEIVEKNVESFVIDTDAKAEWAVKKIHEAREDRDRMVEWYTQKIKEIKESCDFETINLERMLEEYFNTVPHRETKTQSVYDFPGGKLYMKKQNPEFAREDKTVIAWLKDHDGAAFVKVKESLDWDNLKKACAVLDGKMFDANGEEIPGITVTDRGAVFCVD